MSRSHKYAESCACITSILQCMYIKTYIHTFLYSITDAHTYAEPSPGTANESASERARRLLSLAQNNNLWLPPFPSPPLSLPLYAAHWVFSFLSCLCWARGTCAFGYLDTQSSPYTHIEFHTCTCACLCVSAPARLAEECFFLNLCISGSANEYKWIESVLLSQLTILLSFTTKEPKVWRWVVLVMGGPSWHLWNSKVLE